MTRLFVQASSAWLSWVTGFARHQRTTQAGLVDQALEAHALARGYQPPPARLEPVPRGDLPGQQTLFNDGGD